MRSWPWCGQSPAKEEEALERGEQDNHPPSMLTCHMNSVCRIKHYTTLYGDKLLETLELSLRFKLQRILHEERLRSSIPPDETVTTLGQEVTI